MAENPLVTFSVLGARQHYQPIIMAQRNGWLDRLITDLWCPWGGTLSRVNHLFGLKLVDRVAGRYDPRIPRRKIRALPQLALRYKWERARVRNSSEMYAVYSALGSQFAKETCRFISDRSNLFFGFTGASLETIRHVSKRGMGTVLDQIDAGRATHDVTAREEQRFPGLAIGGASPPERYFARVAEEWEVSSVILVNSDWSRQALFQQGVPWAKMTVVPLPYERLDHQQPRHPWQRKLRVLWLGTLSLGKGLPYALEAAQLLLRAPIEFTFAGALEVKARELRFPANAKYLGAVARQHVPMLYEEHDIFIFPTLCDGFGLTQIEALARGLPVISTPCCGEVVDHGKTGFVIPPRDPRALANAILQFVEDRDLLPRLSRNALSSAEGFTPKALWPQYAAVLKRGHRGNTEHRASSVMRDQQL